MRAPPSSSSAWHVRPIRVGLAIRGPPSTSSFPCWTGLRMPCLLRLQQLAPRQVSCATVSASEPTFLRCSTFSSLPVEAELPALAWFWVLVTSSLSLHSISASFPYASLLLARSLAFSSFLFRKMDETGFQKSHLMYFACFN